MRRIIITESKLNRLFEERGEVTFKSFRSNIESIINQRRKNPFCKLKENDYFKRHGISTDKIWKMLLDSGIVVKNESFSESDGGDGKKRSMHHVEYKVPVSTYLTSLRKLKDSLFEGRLFECCAGGDGGGFGVSDGANNCAGSDICGMGSGQFITPLFAPLRRGIYTPKTSKKKRKSKKKGKKKKK